MFGKLVPCYLFAFIFMKLITITQLTFHDSSHGFITKNARYFDDEISHFHEEIGSLRYFQKSDSTAHLNLRFEPEFLDFRERPLGVPHSETVTLFNTDNNKTIDLTSISGNTVHFHSSFFEDKRIPPNGNTSFKIVYLGRQEGPVESTLFLHTSNGFVRYNVRAFGTFSNYRVRPIVGVKLPVNSTFTPVIYMHNPHSEPIQIVEIYSSGGGFHLELPSGQHEGPNDLWEIPSQETKAIIRVRFEAKIAQNHTAYIRIKLHNPEEILIVPLEVEVTPTQNIFHPQGHVDFGIGGSMDVPKEINLCLFNPLKRAIRVHSVSTLSKSIKTQYYNIRINPGNEEENKCVNVGLLTIDWKNAWKTQDYCGKIIVKFRNGKNRTEIPYFLTVLKGGLSYDKLSTTYFLNDKEVDTTERKFEVLNEFLHPIRVMDVKFPFDAESIFKIQTFTPKTINPHEKGNLFNIRLKSGVKRANMQLTSYIKLITNVTEMQIPLLSYNGKVQIHLPFTSDDYSLNIGLIGYYTRKDIFFMLSNPNPVDLPLIHLYTSIPMTELILLGCGTGDHKMLLLRNSFTNLTKCDRITSHGYAIVQMTITTNNVEQPVWGDVQIQTPYENLSLPVHFKVSPGKLSLTPEELIFDNCFPTKICTHPLKIHSSFSEKMSVENVLALPPDKRIAASITGIIEPKMDSIIGQLYFNPDWSCIPECYTGFLSEGTASWLRTMVITKQVSEYDLQLVNMFYTRFLNFTKHGANIWSNITLRLDTSQIKGQIFESKVKYTWPKLISEGFVANNWTVDFPLTQVGNSSQKTLILHNPGSHNVVIQLLFDSDYPHVEMLCDGLPTSLIPALDIKHNNNKVFTFDKKSLEKQRIYFRDSLRVSVYKQSLPFLLLPGQSKRVTLGFTAEDAKAYSSLLLLRNNLTIIEVVKLKARGTVPLFKFGNRKPGALQPLFFELTEKYLTDCKKKDYGDYLPPLLPNLTVKRSFTARNLGEIPVHIYNFYINGYQCEGFGFKVLNCEPFTLQPNTTKKIDITFTPDLTLSKISRTLVVSTSLNTFVNYSLYATVPPEYCEACGNLIDRPNWEIYMSYFTIIFMTIMFFLVIFIAVLDAEALKRQAWENFMASNSPVVLPVLDLRKIGRQVREEIQSKDKKKIEHALEINEEEQETVKSEPAVIPITGKAKRKLAQRNSFNDDENYVEEDHCLDRSDRERNRERQTKKDILFERHRLKSRERKTEKELKLLEEKERKEKHAQQKESDAKKVKMTLNKKVPKVNSIPVQEEETSSTTTESSNSSTNCDEVDKENQILKKWSKKKIVAIQDSNVVKTRESSANIAEHKNKHVSFVNSKLRTKMKAQEKLNDMEMLNDKVFTHNRESKRKDLKLKDRKEKLIYRNKSERRLKVSESDSVSEKEGSKSPISFYIPFPTPTTNYSGWCENKAKFSDVVARSETVHNSPLSPDLPRKNILSPRSNVDSGNCNYLSDFPRQSSPNKSNIEQVSNPFKQSKTVTTKPMMYVEPYKPIDLGPIGSKRLGTPGKESPDLFVKEPHNFLTDECSPQKRLNMVPNSFVEFSPMNDKSVIAAISNNTLLANDTSFFTQPHGVRLDGGDDNVFKNMELWNQQQQQVFKDVRDQEQRRIEPEKDSLLSSEPVDDSWNRALLGTGSDYWSNTFSNVLDSTSKLASNASYLWGSNPVWKPWSPSDLPGTPRRTPPGFDEQIQKKKRIEEEQKKLQQKDAYNPFSSGYTWPQQKDPWD